MAKVGKHGLDEPTLEGGGGGGGMGRGSSSKLDNVFGIEGKALSKSKSKDEIKEVPMDIKGGVEAADKYHAKHFGNRTTGSKAAKDYKEGEKESALSGKPDFGSPKQREYGSGDRSPRTSDDYAKGGSVSSRADGCCVKGKTRGKMM